MSPSAPKKRLPTGPINIAVSQPHKTPANETASDSSSVENRLEESGKQESSKDNLIGKSSQPPNSNTETGLARSNVAENQKQDSSNLVSKNLETQIPENNNQRTITSSSRMAESTLEAIEADNYRKVAMRLSPEAAEQLRSLRLNTGISYEIIVDVLIRHLKNYPQTSSKTSLKRPKKSA
ncbi:MAG: hypothetical protein WCA07_08565 [Gloeobacterales cyanobacterium]